MNFKVLEDYPVLEEKSKSPVAHFKWTVAISSKRVLLLSSFQDLNFELLEMPKLEDEKMMNLINIPLEDFTAKKKKKK